MGENYLVFSNKQHFISHLSPWSGITFKLPNMLTALVQCPRDKPEEGAGGTFSGEGGKLSHGEIAGAVPIQPGESVSGAGAKVGADAAAAAAVGGKGGAGSPAGVIVLRPPPVQSDPGMSEGKGYFMVCESHVKNGAIEGMVLGAMIGCVVGLLDTILAIFDNDGQGIQFFDRIIGGILQGGSLGLLLGTVFSIIKYC